MTFPFFYQNNQLFSSAGFCYLFLAQVREMVTPNLSLRLVGLVIILQITAKLSSPLFCHKFRILAGYAL